MIKYTEKEIKDMNNQVKRWEKRLLNLISDERYDSINLSNTEYETLKIVGNAETYKDINCILFNGMIEKVFESVDAKVRSVR